MTERPPASWIAERLRKIERQRLQLLKDHGSKRPEHWAEDIRDDLTALKWAAEGYDKLAERQGE